MSRVWPLLTLLLISVVATAALPNEELKAHTNYFLGKGALKDGGVLLFFRQGLIGYPQDGIEVVRFEGKSMVLAISEGIIYYMDGFESVKQVQVCAGRVVKMAHAITPRGGVIYALCWQPGENVVSAATIFDSSVGVKWYGLKRPSKTSEEVGFVWSDYRVEFPSSEEPARPMVADMDGDGYDEAVYFLDGKLLYFDSPLSIPKEILMSSTPKGFAYGDVNGDGKEEVVIATATEILTWQPGERLSTYSKYGCTSEPVLADLDGDGVKEVACLSGSSLIAVDGNRLLIKASGATSPAAADLNSDGLADLVYVTSDGTLEARSVKGVLWTLKVERPFFTPAIGDVDGDYSPEVVLGAGKYLLVISAEGKEKWRKDLREPDAWVSRGKIDLTTYVRYEAKTSPVLYDFDGDGLLEILLGIGAYLEQGRIVLIDDVRGMGNPPIVEILSPANYSKVGNSLQLTFRVSDDLSPVLPTKVYKLVDGDWVEEWSGKVDSGKSVQLTLPSADEIRVETTDGLLRSSAILKLKVDKEAPQLVIEPRNMSVIGPGTNITVRMIAPIKEYAFLTVYHGTGPGGQWVKIIDKRRIWKTTELQIDVTPIVKKVRGYHYFRFMLEDSLGNKREVIMRYRIGEDQGSEKRQVINGNVELSILVPRNPVSRNVNLSWILIGTPNATLYYGKGLDWTLLRVVEGNGSIIWDVSKLENGIYYLKLSSENASVMATLEVDNTPPIVEISADRTKLRVNETAVLTVKTDAKKLYWDLDGDGKFETVGHNVARISVREPGNVTVGVMGVDEANNSRVATVTLEVSAPSSATNAQGEAMQTIVYRGKSWTDRLMGIMSGTYLGLELVPIPLALIGLVLLIKLRNERKGRKRNKIREGDMGKREFRGSRTSRKRDDGRRVENPWRSL